MTPRAATPALGRCCYGLDRAGAAWGGRCAVRAPVRVRLVLLSVRRQLRSAPGCIRREAAQSWVYVLIVTRRQGPMGNHLTPSELAKESGLDRKEVIVRCVEWGVPIFEGKIDKTLFNSALRELGKSGSGQAVTA